jgi:hypothetical protein
MGPSSQRQADEQAPPERAIPSLPPGGAKSSLCTLQIIMINRIDGVFAANIIVVRAIFSVIE